jgi:hypothetical protein
VLQDDFVPEYTTYLDKAREAKEAKKFRSIMAEEMEGETGRTEHILCCYSSCSIG